MKKKIYWLLNVTDNEKDASWWIDVFISLLISLNVIAIILESVEAIKTRFIDFFILFEIFSVIVFTIEYLLRVWVASENPKFSKPITGRIRYMFTPMAIVDFLAILPFYLPFFGIDMRMLRMLRLFRLFRLFKIARYVKAIALIGDVFRQKREELILSLVFTFFLLLLTSSVMYYVENYAQPDSFASIPQTMWWGISTLTTVGYGDVYPITTLGKFFGGIISVLGIGLFALPTGILASGFASALDKRKDTKATDGQNCPHCGSNRTNLS